MAATIGTIGPYQESEDFDTYVDRVELFFEANSIDDAKKVATFLSIVGAQVYGLVQNLTSPKKPKECTYKEIIDSLKNHYKPKVIVVYERFKFYNRVQGTDESIADFAAGLKACAHTCQFGTSLKEMLRDRLICGIRNEATQRAFLTEADLTYERAVEMATAREAAARDVHAMSRPNHNVHAVSTFPKPKQNNKANTRETKPTKPCSGCGSNHWRNECPFKDAICFGCEKKGHILKCCFNAKNKNTKQKFNAQFKGYSKQNNYVSNSNASQDGNNNSSSYDNFIFNNYCFNVSTKPVYMSAELAGKLVKMEVDTGASRSIISSANFNDIWVETTKRPKLLPTTQQLKVWGGKQLPILGEIKVPTKLCGTSGKTSTVKPATFVIVEGQGPILFGRDNLATFDLLPFSFLEINKNEIDELSSNLAKQFPDLFSEGLGCLKDQIISIDIDSQVPPKFCKARTVPYAMKPRLDKALDALIEDGIVTPLTYSKWAAPVVPVVKSDGSIRVCGDYKLTANRAIKLDTYPIPKPEDLFSSLSGGKYFSKLDMSQAYCQLRIDETSQDITVINTHRGLFKYNRLCFGISAAPGIFQRSMEQLLQGIPGVLCYLDDILICGKSEVEHKSRLQAVLARLQDAGVKLKLAKCYFKVPEVSYLGFRIDADGLHPTQDKVKAIVEAPAPTNLKQLESFLGVFNFYRRFVPNASTILEPLNRLRRSGVLWQWEKEQESAFEKSKQHLLDSQVLVHFDPKLPISVVSDSSSYGLGAVLSHIIDGQERPVCFASRTLLPAERNYPQVEREALAIVFALRHFHNYLWGQPKFRVVTDHKPLLGIFSPTKAIAPMASGRIQRWALMLQAYSFDLVHRSGVILGTADALSRLPLKVPNESAPIPGEWTNLVNFLNSSPVNAKNIQEHTRTNPVLSKVLRYCELGWPTSLPEGDQTLMAFFRKRNELTIEAGCILWGARVVIPPCDRMLLLSELHAGHVGASRMKELARSYLWWPNLDGDLEDLVKQCPSCLENRKTPPKAELHPWEWPSQPWHRLHLDYAGPVQGKYFLVLVDAHSKWVEIFPTNGPSTSETIKCLRHCFCQLGLPVTIVSDNGTCFTSKEFKDFLQTNGIRQVTSAVYKPSTNGLAERMVQTFKSALTASKESYTNLLDKFLFKYRVTPHSTTGVSPAELLFKRKLRCRLDLLHPQEMVAGKVTRSQEAQKHHHTGSPRYVNLEPKTPVFVRNFAAGPKWRPAVVTQKHGPISYKCQLDDGRVIKRHQDQVILGNPDPGAVVSPMMTDPVRALPAVIPMPTSPHQVPSASVTIEESPASSPPVLDVQPTIPPTPPTLLRRSKRHVRQPDRLDL